MPNDAVEDSGKRFGRDLRRIREERAVDVDAIHESTRIARTLIETFEEDGLLDHPAFNRVYLRSFVRSYAECIDLPEDVALDALDRALEGEYTNQLAAYALDDVSDASDEAPDSEPSGPASTTAGDADNEDPVAEAPSVTEGRSGDVDETTHSPAAEGASEAGETEEGAGDAQASTRTHPRMAPKGQPREGSGPVASRGRPSSAPDEASTTPESDADSGGEAAGDFAARSTGTQLVRVVLIGLGVILVLGLGLWLAWGGEHSSAPVPADTSQSDRSDTPQRAGPAETRAPAPVTLGDTLYLTVVAEQDVRGIRIQRDDDLRRPYWVDAGEATVFPFRERATVEEELDRVRLLLEGYPYPVTRRDARGRIVITRDTAEAFVDTLRADPVRLDAPRDTNYIPAFAQ